MPFFSIIIPTYNNELALYDAINSVLEQTFDDFELIIIDDGSTDNTGKLVGNLNDIRLIYKWQKNSGGPASPRNYGMRVAKGEWICYLDSDDIWYKNKLEIAYQYLISNKMDIFYSNEVVRILKNNSITRKRYREIGNNPYLNLLSNGNQISTSTVILSKKFINNHNLQFNESENYVIVEDYDFWLNIASLGGNFKHIPEYLGEYIINDNNISNNKKKYFKNLEHLISDHINKIGISLIDKKKLHQKILTQIEISKAMESYRAKKYLYSLSIILKTFYISPVNFIKYGIKYLKNL